LKWNFFYFVKANGTYVNIKTEFLSFFIYWFFFFSSKVPNLQCNRYQHSILEGVGSFQENWALDLKKVDQNTKIIGYYTDGKILF
jgi:hypothetical protein